MTAALVLAAGLGQRLSTVHDGPKWLVPVGESSPMREQLAAIDAHPAIDRVVVVANEGDGPVAAAVSDHRLTKPVEVIVNDRADIWNNWSSALAGLVHLDGEACLLFNSDLYAERGWFTRSITDITASSEPALLVDVERPLTDEAMKVAGDPSIEQIGKVGVQEPVGEYVGLAWWPTGSATRLEKILDGYRADVATHNNWYEHGIDADVKAETAYRLVPAPSTAWVEIDDPDDLDAARRLTSR